MSQTLDRQPAVLAVPQHPAAGIRGGRMEQLRRQLRILQVERAVAHGLAPSRLHHA